MVRMLTKGHAGRTVNTLRTGLLNCLNAHSWGLIQSRSGFYKHPSAGPFGDRLHVLHN